MQRRKPTQKLLPHVWSGWPENSICLTENRLAVESYRQHEHQLNDIQNEEQLYNQAANIPTDIAWYTWMLRHLWKHM